jgi:peptidoglycan hydrolase-like protein with peptidoglycan-binding domain
MNKIIKKIAAFTMAFTILGTGTAIVKTISPDSFTTLTASATGEPNYWDYERPEGNFCIGYMSTGNRVKWIQAALNIVTGAYLDVDGIYGYKTKQAVKNFQSWANDHMRSGCTRLAVDGIYGPCTASVLEECIEYAITTY